MNKPMAMIIALFLCGSAVAGPFGIFGRRAASGTNQPSAPASGGLWTAQQSAEYQAARCQMGHFGNPSGGFEGVGCASTAAAALANTCKPHNGPPRDWGVCQGRNGLFYACRRW